MDKYVGEEAIFDAEFSGIGQKFPHGKGTAIYENGSKYVG